MIPEFDSAFESIVQESYGKVVACLLRDGLDLVQAEDAVAVAMERAWRFWPVHGLPESPEAWLLTVARRWARDDYRSRQREHPMEGVVEPWSVPSVPEEIPDERLRLCYLCAHPALEPHEQTALMLQLVIGLTAERLAGLYCIPPAAMSQRLVRAKRKLVALGANRFQDSLTGDPARLEAVLEAIYGAYSMAWEAPDQEDQRSWARELMALSQALVHFVPNESEALGLLSLIQFSESRRVARRSSDGQFIPLEDQEPGLWESELWKVAEASLQQAARARTPGRYQLEAAIQSAHMQRLSSGGPDLSTILKLYNALAALHPTWGVQLGRIALLARVLGPELALAELDRLSVEPSFQPFWAVRAQLLSQAGREEEAAEARARAASTVSDPAVVGYLLRD